MRTFIVKTLEKKSVVSREFWETDQPDPFTGRKAFVAEELFRWGEAVISVPDDDEEFDDLETLMQNENGFCPQWYDVEDQNLDDGCALDFETIVPGPGTEEYEEVSVEEIEQLWEDNRYEAFEEAGYEFTDVEVMFYGPLEIEEINDEETN